MLVGAYDTAVCPIPQRVCRYSASCDGSADQIGWKLDGGKLVAPTAGQAAEQCVTTHNYQYDVDCPPPTSTSGPVGCGPVVTNCSRATAEGESS